MVNVMSSSIEWKVRHFDELEVNELYALLQLRSDVFVVEQQCAYADPDGVDSRKDVLHLLGSLPTVTLACYARAMGPDTTAHNCGETAVSIGRVVCSSQVRGCGAGRQLMTQAIALCEDHWPEYPIRISAQAHLSAFYSSLGFEAQGEIYLEDNIPHIAMRRAVVSR